MDNSLHDKFEAKNNLKLSENPIKKQYFNLNINNPKRVKINLNNYKYYGQLLKAVQKNPCRDKVSTLVIENSVNIKEIDVNSDCINQIPLPSDPKNRNTIYLEKGVLIKNNQIINIDSLKYIFKKDVENYGINSNYSETPKKLVFIILDEKKSKTELLENILNKITEAYDFSKTKETLNIFITEYIEIPPLPPEPKY